MKTAVVGGGPGGLYCALLLKKADPSRDVTVIERNPADATYGWGVVFSDRTLTSFREADYKTFVDITENFVEWDAIDVRYRDEVVRCGGQGFSGVGRKLLLNILQRRCDELGVKLAFATEVKDIAELRDADLIVAADGVHSGVRRAYERSFRPRVSEGDSRYIWFGTNRPFDSFTFIFRESDHGLFQVHAYPYDGETSTFIVECADEVWRRARLDDADDLSSIAYCEKLFADDLRGHVLMSNNSRWYTFLTLRTATWSHDNVVLVGDAAHTAHFTIGSGTKLAMEDAIALSNAFEEHDGMEAALAHYEMERRPVVERFQDAAAESQSYFENVARYLHMEPPQFAFHLLTRSGRVDHDNLRLRDPYFVDRVDRWFARQASDGTGADVVLPRPPALVPLKLREASLPNRAVARVAPTDSASDGMPGEEHERALVAAARGEPGLVMTELVAVSGDARITPGSCGIYDADQVEAWRGIVARVHEVSDAEVAIRLGHAGRRGSTRPRHAGLDRPLLRDGWPVLSASAIPYQPYSPVPKEMDRDDMARVVGDFGAAARSADDAGFDVIHLHMGHGYLLGSFISPLTNVRTDGYGGGLEQRMVFPLEVFDAVRAAWPRRKLLSVAFNASDWAAGGVTLGDATLVATMLQQRGCDFVEVLAGQTTADARPVYGRAFLSSYGDVVRNEARVATLVGGNITTTGEVNTLVAGGRADLCVVDLLP